MKVLVGHTGFVGSNLAESASFDYCFNSKDIENAYGLNPDLLVYSGVRAEKFLANKEPEKDFLIVLSAIENIKKINPKKIVLISTVDVYPNPVNVDEESDIDSTLLQPYGKNRLYLENWVEKHCLDYLIIRLPGLFGKNLKKNFIYDMISVIPSMLNTDLYKELSTKEWVKDNYSLQENGFYILNELDAVERETLKQQFLTSGFSALNFTDSRGKFQFYNLRYLWNDMERMQKAGIRKVNLATEPISVSEIYSAVFGKSFENELNAPVPNYDFHSKYSHLFGGSGKYISSKNIVLEDIINFIKARVD